MDKKEALRILHIEDDAAHAELIRYTLLHSDLNCDITQVMSRKECMRALHEGAVDIVLSDNSGYDFSGLEILETIRKKYPGLPFLLLSGSFEGKDVQALKATGVAECLLKSDLAKLAPTIRSVMKGKT
ncbi:MAG: response regulator [Gammaproteobacteria bacterium]